MAKELFSETGVAKGYGTDRYKWVSGLTPEERQAVRNGDTVYIEADARSGGTHGTFYRQVTYTPGYGYSRRVPVATDEHIDGVRNGQ